MNIHTLISGFAEPSSPASDLLTEFLFIWVTFKGNVTCLYCWRGQKREKRRQPFPCSFPLTPWSRVNIVPFTKKCIVSEEGSRQRERVLWVKGKRDVNINSVNIFFKSPGAIQGNRSSFTEGKGNPHSSYHSFLLNYWTEPGATSDIKFSYSDLKTHEGKQQQNSEWHVPL